MKRLIASIPKRRKEIASCSLSKVRRQCYSQIRSGLADRVGVKSSNNGALNSSKHEDLDFSTEAPPIIARKSWIEVDFKKTPRYSKEIQERLQNVLPITHYKEDDVKISRIFSNSLKVASLESHGKMANITVLMKASHRFESDEERGLCQIVHKLAFLESKNYDEKSLLDMQERVMFNCELDFESLTYNVTFMRNELQSILPALADAILFPKVTDENLKNVLETIEMQNQEELQNPVFSQFGYDMIFKSSFKGGIENGLRPLLQVQERKIVPEDIYKYIQKYFKSTGCVIVGVNVGDHQMFVESIEKRFKQLDVNQRLDIPTVETASIWQPKECLYQYLEPPMEVMKQNIPALTSVAIAVPGVSSGSGDIYAIHTLEQYVGGGNSFSAGGPGKGLSSLIHQRFLSQYDLYSLKAEHRSFADAGIFVIHASAPHEMASNLPMIVLDVYRTMMDSLTENDVLSAKNRFKKLILSVLEDLFGSSMNLAYDLMYLNRVRSGYLLCQQVDQITMADFKRIYRDNILGSQPSYCVIGNTETVAPYCQILEEFNKIKNGP